MKLTDAQALLFWQQYDYWLNVEGATEEKSQQYAWEDVRREWPELPDKPDADALEAKLVATLGVGSQAENWLFGQQNQQLKSVGGCNAIKSRDLKIGGHVRSPPPLPIQQTEKACTCSGPFSRVPLVYPPYQPKHNAIASRGSAKLDLTGSLTSQIGEWGYLRL